MFPVLELELEDEPEAADESEDIGYVGERVGEDTRERGELVAPGVEAVDEEEDASSRGRNEKLRARAVGGGGGIEVRRGRGAWRAAMGSGAVHLA